MSESKVITREASVTTKNISKVVLLRGAQYPFLILTAMFVPRIMGPSAYGEYALLTSMIVMTTSLIDLGVGEIFGRFVPEFEIRGESATIRRLCSNIFTLKLAVSLIAAAVLFSILLFVYGDRFPLTYYLVLAGILLLIDLGGVPFTLLFGLNQLGKHALRDPMRRALNLTLIIVLFHYFGLLGAILATLLIESALAILYFFWTRDYFHLKDFGIDRTFLRPYLRFGFTFFVAWGLLNVWQRLGNPLIDYMAQDSREVALFDISNQIFLTTVAFLVIAIHSLVPIFTKLLLSGKEEKLITWSMLMIKYAGMLGTVIFGTFVLSGPDLIPLIIGSEYGALFPNGVVLLLGIFPMIFAQLGFVFSMVYKEPGKYFRALCFAFATFLLASILLIPKYASLGCAIATLISYIILAIVMGFYFKEKLVPCLANGFKVITLGFIFIPFVLFRGNLITNLFLVGCSALTYILLLFVVGALDIHELKEILQAVRHRPEALQT